MRHDDAVDVSVEERETRGGAPMTEKARLDVSELKGAAEEGIILKVDLPDGEIIAGGPPAMHQRKLVRSQIGRGRVRGGGGGGGGGRFVCIRMDEFIDGGLDRVKGVLHGLHDEKRK
jgi:hypothetical protein